MSQKYQKIVETVAPGVYKLASGGYRVRVAVGHGKRGVQRDTTFPKRTPLRKMIGWQTDTRAALRRQRLIPATGTLDADIPRYLDTLERSPRLKADRRYQLEAWKDHFGIRRRHTISHKEVQDRVNAWGEDGVAASTIRHRLTALSKLYERLDGKDGNNPVKGVERPREPEPQPDARPVEMIEQVLDALWYRAAMNNRGWKTLARALVLAHTGMRASQLKRLDVDVDIRPYLSGDRPFVQVPAGKGGKSYELPLTSNGKAAFLLFLRVGAAGEFSTQAFYKSWILACDQAPVCQQGSGDAFSGVAVRSTVRHSAVNQAVGIIPGSFGRGRSTSALLVVTKKCRVCLGVSTDRFALERRHHTRADPHKSPTHAYADGF